MGHSVMLSEGTFNIETTIDFGTKSGMTLVGQGIGVTRLSLVAGVNADMISIGDLSTYVPRLTIKDMTLIGNSASQSAGSGINLKSVEGVWLERLEIADFIEHGLYAMGSAARDNKYIHLLHCYLNTSKKAGAYIRRYSYAFMMVNCLLAGNGKTTDWAGLNLETSSDHILLNCLFDENATGIRAYSCSGISISGGQVLGSEKNGIILDGASHDISVGGGIVLIANSQDGDNLFSGIVIDEGTYIAVTGANILGSATKALKYGIEEKGASDYNVFGPNLYRYCTADTILVGASTKQVIPA